MKNNITLYIAIGLSIIAIFVSIIGSNGSSGLNGSSSNEAFERVISSGVLKVGYVVYPPYISKDPKTGQLSGTFYDLTNAIGGRLNLKVEWVEEAGYGTISESLTAGRYDVYGGIWPSADRSKVITFTEPVYYDALYAYARTSDNRFNNNLDLINSADVRISTIDGELSDTIAKESYSKAQRISLPQTATADQLELQVISNKADITFLPPMNANLFLKSNPGVLKKVSDTPVRVYGTTLGVKLGETNLENMLNVVIEDFLNSGTAYDLVIPYDPTILKVAPPYIK